MSGYAAFDWGLNSSGQLGQSNTTDQHAPIQLGSEKTWTVLGRTSNGGSFGIKGGHLYVWGYNAQGQLGMGDTASRSSPVQLGGLTWTDINGGWKHALGITGGQLFAWGDNTYGKLGLNDTTSRSSPVQVGVLTTWSRVFPVARGHSSFALKTDGTLWAMGRNNYAQLGVGGYTNRSSPTQVGAGVTTWTLAAAGQNHGIGVRSDKSLWSWGTGNSTGQSNGAASFTTPTRIGALSTWVTPFAGQYFSGCIKDDGTMWTWGTNSDGQLGLNDTTNRSSPVQVGGTTWSKAVATQRGVIALRTDGTLWAWGYNGYGGQLGLGDTTSRSSPVQVGVGTTWQAGFAAGDFHVLALFSPPPGCVLRPNPMTGMSQFYQRDPTTGL